MVTQTPLNIINVFPSEASYESNKGSLGANEISLVSGVGVILESYTSGKSWYKKYSNGWVEQGGTFTSLYDQAVTLIVPMKDTNYNILTSKTNYGSAVVIITTVTTTSFNVLGRGQGGSGFGENVSGYWYVAGWGSK
nr:MAG: hypothetical protein [Bacteriophage sp.]UWI03265.1 MAG: hypothetical protein [Bacteriophage sp.]